MPRIATACPTAPPPSATAMARIRPGSQQREQFRGQLEDRGEPPAAIGEPRLADREIGADARARAAERRAQGRAAALSTASTAARGQSRLRSRPLVVGRQKLRVAARRRHSGEAGDERHDVAARPAGPRRSGRLRRRRFGRRSSPPRCRLSPRPRRLRPRLTDGGPPQRPKAIARCGAPTGATSCPATDDDVQAPPHGLSRRLGRRPQARDVGRRQGDDRGRQVAAGHCRCPSSRTARSGASTSPPA